MPTREALIEMLESNGAISQKSVTKRTNVLFVGEGYGKTKIEKAQAYGIPCLSLPMGNFLGLLEEYPNWSIDAALVPIYAAVIIDHALTCELLYGQYLRHRDGSPERAERYFRSFITLATGFSELLQRYSGGD